MLTRQIADQGITNEEVKQFLSRKAKELGVNIAEGAKISAKIFTAPERLATYAGIKAALKIKELPTRLAILVEDMIVKDKVDQMLSGQQPLQPQPMPREENK
jgi:hypothetical protein